MKRCRVVLFVLILWSFPATAHELHGHRGPTYEITEPARIEPGQPRLKLSVLDQETGKPTAARFSLVVDGKDYIEKKKDGPIHRWRIAKRVRITRSSWLAARGEGVAKRALKQHTRIAQNTIAHTGPVRVLLADQPIKSAQDATFLIRHLRSQIELYGSKAKYKEPQDRDRAIGLFQSAIKELERQLDR